MNKITQLKFSAFVLAASFAGNCDELNDALADKLANLETVDKIQFTSDYSILSAVVPESINQASLPWVLSSFLFTTDVEGFDVPVLLTADEAAEVELDIKITTSGGTPPGASAVRDETVVYDGKSVAPGLLVLEDIFGAGATIPDESPILAGKTVNPMYAFVTINDFEWGDYLDEIVGGFETAIDNIGGDPTGAVGDLEAVYESATDIPAPWFCETVKIEVTYTRPDGEKIVGTKEVPADPEMIVDLLAAGGSALTELLEPPLKMDLSAIQDVIEGMAEGNSCDG